MIEKHLLRLMLQYDFWNENKKQILRSMFPSNLQSVYDVLSSAHDKLKRDLNVQELTALWSVDHPVATEAQKKALFLILNDLPREIGEDAAKEILKKAWIIESGRRLSKIGIQIINGKTPEIEKARKIIEEISTGRISELEQLQPLSNELDDILEAIDQTQKWKYNLTNLQKVVPGIGPGILKAAFGRVESGKSAYWISLAAGPGGFAHQGARVFSYCNEEAAQRSQGRAVMACSGIPLAAIKDRRDEVLRDYGKIKDNLKFYEVKGASIYQIEEHIKQEKPDIFIVDQADKLSIEGSFAREDERLGALYIRLRDICTNLGCAGIVISQANAEAEGKTYLSTANMALSRTAKSAELDILIGIGKSPLHSDTSRVLNVTKNKLSGRHDDVICQLKAEISRYED